jgi:hypothetical protein
VEFGGEVRYCVGVSWVMEMQGTGDPEEDEVEED